MNRISGSFPVTLCNNRVFIGHLIVVFLYLFATGNVILDPCEGAETYVNGKRVTTPIVLKSGKQNTLYTQIIDNLGFLFLMNQIEMLNGKWFLLQS